MKRLELNSALRESSYRNEGLEGTTGETRTHSFTTWKVSGIYDPLDWLRVRATRSHDMRAANFRELYYGQKIKAGGSFGFCGPTGTVQRDPCDFSLEGNVARFCAGGQCTELTRCPAINWTQKDRTSGFSKAWDARVRTREATQKPEGR